MKNLTNFLDQFDPHGKPNDRPEKNLLYHYTNSHGLHGIVKNNCLWATDQRFLNDTKEFQHAVDIANEVLAGLTPEHSGEEEFFSYVSENLLGRAFEFPVFWFVVSLSEEPDLLSQWRAYGGRGGYSIGFNYKNLCSMFDSNFKLIRCIYDEAKQKELIETLILESALDFSPDHMSINDSSSAENNSLMFFGMSFMKLASAFKHPSFREEKEWRLVGVPGSNETQLRCSDTLIVPYVQLPLDNVDTYGIDEIWVGPNANLKLATESIQLFNELYKKKWVYKTTGCPYRI